MIFMDIHMPGMDGLTATRKIMEDKSIPFKPHIVGLSAHAKAEDQLAGKEAGMKDFITKPFKHHEFCNVIKGFFLRCKKEKEAS